MMASAANAPAAPKQLIIQVFPNLQGGTTTGGSGGFPLILLVEEDSTVSKVVEKAIGKYVEEEKHRFFKEHQKSGAAGSLAATTATSNNKSTINTTTTAAGSTTTGGVTGEDPRYQALLDQVWYEKKLPSLFPKSQYYEDYSLTVSDGLGQPLMVTVPHATKKKSSSGSTTSAQNYSSSETPSSSAEEGEQAQSGVDRKGGKLIPHPPLDRHTLLLKSSDHLSFPYMFTLSYQPNVLSVEEIAEEKKLHHGQQPNSRPHPTVALCAPAELEGQELVGGQTNPVNVSGVVSEVAQLQILRGEVPSTVPKTKFTFMDPPPTTNAATAGGGDTVSSDGKTSPPLGLQQDGEAESTTSGGNVNHTTATSANATTTKAVSFDSSNMMMLDPTALLGATTTLTNPNIKSNSTTASPTAAGGYPLSTSSAGSTLSSEPRSPTLSITAGSNSTTAKNKKSSGRRGSSSPSSKRNHRGAAGVNEDTEDEDMRPDELRAALGISHYDIARFGYGNNSSSSKTVCRQQSLTDSKNYILAKREENIRAHEKRRAARLAEREAEAMNRQLSMREEWMAEKKHQKDVASRTALDLAREKDVREREKLRRELEIAEALEKHRKEVEKEESAALSRQARLHSTIDAHLEHKATVRERQLQATVHASATIEKESRRLGPMMGRVNETRPVLKRIDERVRQAQLLDNIVSNLDRTIQEEQEKYEKNVKLELAGRGEVRVQEDGQEMVRAAEATKRVKEQQTKQNLAARKQAERKNEDTERKFNSSMIVQYAKERSMNDSRKAANLNENSKLTQASASLMSTMLKPDPKTGLTSPSALEDVGKGKDATETNLSLVYRRGGGSTTNNDITCSSSTIAAFEDDEETKQRYLAWKAERVAKVEADLARKEICAHRTKRADGSDRSGTWTNPDLTTDKTRTTLESLLEK